MTGSWTFQSTSDTQTFNLRFVSRNSCYFENIRPNDKTTQKYTIYFHRTTRYVWVETWRRTFSKTNNKYVLNFRNKSFSIPKVIYVMLWSQWWWEKLVEMKFNTNLSATDSRHRSSKREGESGIAKVLSKNQMN